ncbi:hypothetical protein [Salinivirga cyanobacteriivorans]
MRASLLFIIFTFSLLTNNSVAQVLDYSTSITIDNNKKVTETTYLIQINQKESAHLSDITIYHDAKDKFKLLEAYVIDANGDKVKKVKKRDVKTRNRRTYSTFYQDDLIEEFDLHWSTYPHLIKYAYRIIEKDFVFIANWTPYIKADLKVKSSTLTVDIPEDYGFKSEYADAFRFKNSDEKGRKVLEWNLGSYETPEDEALAPPLAELIPRVIIVPQKFEYGVEGSSENWQTFGLWQLKLNAGTDLLTTSEKERVDKLIKGIDSKREIARTLYHYMQDNTHYINVSIDFGGLKSYPASYVCDNKYGDCKALTTYMKALLKYAGIESFYTKIRAGENTASINENLPSQQFNHVILCVPMEQDTIWLENTSSTAPFNYLGSFTQNRKALVVNGDQSKLVKTPAMNLGDVLEKRNYRFTINKNGTGKISINQKLRGDAFEAVNYYKRQASESDQKDFLNRISKVGHFTLKNWSFKKVNRDAKEITVSMNGIVKNQFRVIGQMLVLKPIEMDIPELEAPSERTHDLKISMPVNIFDSAVYNMPFQDGFNVSVPQDTIIESDYGIYRHRYEKRDSIITVTQRFQMYPGRFPKEKYKDFYEFIESIFEYRKQSVIVLNPKE